MPHFAPVALAVAAALLSAGCAAVRPPGSEAPAPLVERVAEELPGPRPRWVDLPTAPTADALYFAGQSVLHATERDARDEALRTAVEAFARYCGVDVAVADEVLSTSLSRASEVTDPTIARRSAGTQSAEAYVSRVQGDEWYLRRIERLRAGALVDGGWQAWVQVKVPPDEVGRVQARQESKRREGLEAKAGPFLEPYARASSLLDSGRALAASRPLEALSAWLDALEQYEALAARDGFGEASAALRSLGYEVPLPMDAEIRKLLAALLVESAPDRATPPEGENAPSALTARVTLSGQPLAGIPVVLAGQGGQMRALTGADGAAVFSLDRSLSPPGKSALRARIDHPALRRAAYRFPLPPDAVFTLAGHQAAAGGSAASAGSSGAGIDYAGGWVEATALGSADVRKAVSGAQAETVALRTARHLAYAALAETVGRVQVDATSTYRDAMDADSQLQVSTQALLRGAQVVGESVEWADDPLAGHKVPRATVTVRLPLFGPEGVAQAVRRSGAPADPAPRVHQGPAAEPAGPRYDGLIVDASAGAPACEPALLPEILDETGAVVYGPATPSPSTLGALGGAVRYAPSVEAARRLLGGAGPVLVAGTTACPGKGRFTIPAADARAAAEANEATAFLTAGRVAVVLDPGVLAPAPEGAGR